MTEPDRPAGGSQPGGPDEPAGPSRPEGPADRLPEPTGRVPEPTGRELVRREAVPPSTQRFTAPDTAHTVGLTEERAAKIVRQSANARSIGLAAILFVLVFIPIYWFWENGFPLLPGTSRLAAEATTEYVTDVARGEGVFLANCARCHGPMGKGDTGPYGYVDSHGTGVIGFSTGIGPPLNDQIKLYQALTKDGQPGTGHLNPNYLKSVLTEGGRYVCGDPKSLMPVWAQSNGGPLDYRAVQELIAFITASSDITWQTTVVDPATGAQTVETHHGWRDPTYNPGPGATPFPACWRAPQSTPAAAATLPPGTVPGTSASPRVIKIDATANITFDPTSIALKAGEVVRFEITNTATFNHNFFVGAPDDLTNRNVSTLQGVPDATDSSAGFAGGTTVALTYTVPSSGTIGFACLIQGHLEAGMRGSFTIVP